MDSGAVEAIPSRMSGLTAALDRPLVFVGGKGGVGKTTVAAGVALASAAAGHRTLLVSTDPAHSTCDVLGLDLGPLAAEVGPRLRVLELDPEVEVDRYMDEVRSRLETSVPPRLAGEVAAQLAAARGSPGAEEAAVFDRFTRVMEEADGDRIVFDTAPSGHTLRLLSLPETMTDWLDELVARRRKIGALGTMWRNVAGGAAGSRGGERDLVLEALEERRDRFERTRGVLRDPASTSFVFVTLAERLPILETHRVMNALVDHQIPVGGVIVNQLLPPGNADPFMDRRRAREARHLADIAVRFGDWPIGYLPLVEDDPVGPSELTQLIGRLRTGESEDRP